MAENKPAGGEPKRPETPPELPGLGWRYIVWVIAISAFMYYYWSTTTDSGLHQSIAYSEFKARVRADAVTKVTLQGERVIGTYRAGAVPAQGNQTRSSTTFTTTLPPVNDPELIPLLEQHHVEIDNKPTEAPWWLQAIMALIPWLFFIALFFFISRRVSERFAQGGGLFGFSKSKARLYRKGTMQLSFDDVAGLDNAKADLREITAYLKSPERYRKLGAKIPRGILLMGPPGTGKTLLARAMAGEADVPFFSISGSEFVEMFVGVGAARVRDMFIDAKKSAPAIIFIDEIDSVGRARGTGLGGGHDEREQTLNQILNEMDGFSAHEAVVVLAATNRPDVLDPALLRPGRFDRKVVLDLPDKKARLAILKIHSREVPLAADVDLERLASLTVGFSGADLENLVNEAALLTGREEKSQVDMNTLMAARDKVVLGARRENVISEAEKKVIAYHESGHAVVASLLPHADPLDKVTIIPRGRALGATEQIPEEEHYNLQQSYLRDRIGVLLGGRTAERLVFGEVSSGAEDDLKQATRLAQHMITHWGMSERLGPVAFRRGEEHIFLGREMAQARDFSEHTAQIIDDEIRKLVKEVEQEVIQLLTAHRTQLDALATALLEKETLGASEIRQLVSG
ncbi:MAG: ATP-dependent zinc metalloprotease FtsH [Gammaproteobacteria bacterium]|nr:ATP-dependent zinc metalloprotease FtsH [Gammaproteobacteria bacterium]